MPIVQSKEHSKRIFTISAPNFKETISCDLQGVAKVSDQAWQLLSTKYPYKNFVVVEREDVAPIKEDKIEKVEISEPLIKEEGEPLKTPEVIEVSPAEIIEEEESLEDVINAIDAIDELKAFAKDLGLPEDEWNTYKRKDHFKNYLIGKINEETEK
jgi:hypothetical protein